MPGTCRNRQKWVPQAWNDAVEEGGVILESSLLASNDEQRQAAKFEAGEGRDAACGGGQGKKKGVTTGHGGVGAGGGEGEGGSVYDLLAVVVHRGSAYSGHYHALIRDCLQEVRQGGRAGG